MIFSVWNQSRGDSAAGFIACLTGTGATRLENRVEELERRRLENLNTFVADRVADRIVMDF